MWNERESDLPRAVSKLLERNGELLMPSAGTSMFPLIKEGDICRFVVLQDEILRKGDILLVASEGKLIGHRLIRIDGQGEERRFVCKGDSNLQPDQPALRGQVLGTLAAIRKGRSSIEANRGLTRLWGAALLAIPGLSRGIRLYLRMRRGVRINEKRREA